ncbi:hypothetical protein [Sulfitobacter sp. SK011]|uniref:hypothetical protein n=1 Tax=Sulfitobacter sp. SK011 TaxID=1389004 RepID=UPI000E0AEBB2|nr:hypothetical protein [Sulfitobacter sp. SK011]AXI43753.1 hypothetical protein C1J02_18885 [Sulfitobacter sp. SK011]
MSLSPQIRKHIYPVLKRQGFEKHGGLWCLEKDEDWLIVVETRSSKFGDEGLYYFEVDIGFFSRAVDDLMGWSRQAGFTEANPIPVPNGILGAHFESSLFDFDDNGVWVGVPDNLFLPKGAASEAAFLEFALKLERVIPKAFERYASYESLIECKRKRIGRSSQSKQASMYAAAACIKLERYDEAREFLEDAVRPGSTQFMKDVGARLNKIIDAAS